MIDLTKEERNPLLIFDEDDTSTFEHYKTLVKYLIEKEQKSFPAWIEAMDLAKDINTFNHDPGNLFNNYLLAYQSKSTAKKEHMESMVQSRALVRRKLLTDIVNTLLALIKTAKSRTDDDVIYAIAVESFTGFHKGREYNLDALQLGGLLDEYKHCLKKSLECGLLHPDSIEPVPHIVQGVSPYLRLGKTKGAQEITNIIYSKDNRKEDQKLRAQMISMYTAERCSESDVLPLFRLLAKGLRFGIGLLIESIPHVIQLKVMSLLKSKAIDTVFASQSMRMGIDYPIRSCVIRANKLRIMNAADILQMAGRAGRRRKDTCGHAIFINILNVIPAHGMDVTEHLQSFIPRLQLPIADMKKGYYINDLNCIIELITEVRCQGTLKEVNDSVKLVLNDVSDDMHDQQSLLDCDVDVYGGDIRDRDDHGEHESALEEFHSLTSSSAPSGLPTQVSSSSSSNTSSKPVRHSLTGSSTYYERKKKLRAKRVQDGLVMSDTTKKNMETFCDIFKGIVDKILLKTHGREQYPAEKNKVKDMKELFHATVTRSTTSLSGELTPDRARKLREQLDMWGRTFQEIYMIYRGCQYKQFLSTLENAFECLHQSKYKLSVV
jgi:hypothetical protein